MTSQQLALLKKHFPNWFDKNGAFITHKLQDVVQSADIALSKERYTLNMLGFMLLPNLSASAQPH